MAISLNDHENRIKSFEGKLPDIENRINNLVSSAKSWEIVTLRSSSVNTFLFDQKYNSYNFIVYRLSTSISGGSLSVDATSGSFRCYGTGGKHVNVRYSFSKNSNTISASISSGIGGNVMPTVTELSVLFYK